MDESTLAARLGGCAACGETSPEIADFAAYQAFHEAHAGHDTPAPEPADEGGESGTESAQGGE